MQTTNTFEVRVKQNVSNNLKLGHKYRLSFEATTTDSNLNAFISTTNGQNNQLDPTNAINNGPISTNAIIILLYNPHRIVANIVID